MTTEVDVGLVCRRLFMKPGMSIAENEDEAEEAEGEALVARVCRNEQVVTRLTGRRGRTTAAGPPLARVRGLRGLLWMQGVSALCERAEGHEADAKRHGWVDRSARRRLRRAGSPLPGPRSGSLP